MSTQPDIQTSPGIANWISCVLGFVMASCIAAIVPLLALDYFYLHSSTGRAPTIGIVASIGFGTVVGAWFMERLFDRLYWRLTQTDLVCGIRGKMRLPLSSIQKIIVGLPNKFAIPGIELFAPQQIRSTSILLCFSGHSILPMHLHGMPNGSLLMNELVSRFSERVDQHYTYSKDEIKLLRKPDINVLIKKKNVTSPNWFSAN